jgi:hypothetical protein
LEVKLPKWIHEHYASWRCPAVHVANFPNLTEGESEEEDEIEPRVCETMGSMEMVDGQLVIQTFMPGQMLAPILAAMEGEEEDDDADDID